MNITVVKEELLKLYEKSLFFSEDYIGHPIRVIQAVKSIIGINTDKPVDSLLEFCKVYTDKYKFIEKINYKDSDFDLPPMVSYKKLEESLLNKDLEGSYRNIYCLTTVSEGMQVIEFLLEYSLKYSKESYLFIWSVYRMMLFTDKKFIFRSLLLCVNATIKSKSLITFNYREFNNRQSINWLEIKDSEFELIAIIFSIYHSKLVRKETINDYIDKFLSTKKDQITLIEKDGLHDIDRVWINSYFRELLPENIKSEDVLYYDAIRSVIKCTNENNLIMSKIKNYIEKVNAVK